MDTTTAKNELHQYIDQMNDYQLRIVLGFIKRLFRIQD